MQDSATEQGETLKIEWSSSDSSSGPQADVSDDRQASENGGPSSSETRSPPELSTDSSQSKATTQRDAGSSKVSAENQCVISQPHLNNVQVRGSINMNVSNTYVQPPSRTDETRIEGMQQAAKPGEVPCDVCTGTKLKALKSCLVCLTSYCETHLEPHLTVSGLKRHQLIDPVENLEDRMCMKHDKPLELFCKTDQTCVCMRCSVLDHKTHEFVPLREEYEGKKAELEKTEAEIQEMIQKRQLKIQKIKQSVNVSKGNADREKAEGDQVFTALMESVHRSLNELIETVEEKQRTTEKQAEAFIKELEQEISELEKRSSEVEQLSRSEDHLHLLQNFPSLKAAPPTKDWTEVSVRLPSYERTVMRAVAQLEETLSKEMKKLFEAELKRVQQYAVDVTLDPDTAHPALVLSDDGKQVNYSSLKKKKNLPDNPERFSHCPNVLGKQSFSSGRFYFEVQVKWKTQWDLGVAGESVCRKGVVLLSFHNGYWTMGLRKGNQYLVYSGPSVRLSLQSEPQKVGVFVDYEEGLVSFYDVDAATLMYSCRGCIFTEKLYPFFSPCFHEDADVSDDRQASENGGPSSSETRSPPELSTDSSQSKATTQRDAGSSKVSAENQCVISQPHLNNVQVRGSINMNVSNTYVQPPSRTDETRIEGMQQAAKPGEVPCDVCTGTKLKALKSCLVCLTSYCETHLEPHLTVSGLKRHQLIDPVENLEDRMCMKHDKPLELFCKTDQTCVCMRCSVLDHKTHEFVPLREEYEGKKAELEKTEAEIQEMIQKRQLKIQKIKQSVNVSKGNADREKAEGDQVFTALMESVHRSLNELIETVEEKQRTTEKQAEAFIKELEQEISELEKRSSEVEQLSRSEDHLHLLQNFPSLKAAPPTKDWTEVSVRLPSYERTVMRAVAQLEETLSKEMKKLFEAELKRVQQYAVDVTLDPDTAHPALVLSDDGKQVNYSSLKKKKNLPDNPERFSHCPNVLGKQSFSSGRFYFEVQVKWKTQWDLGVAGESVCRKGVVLLSFHNGYWTMGLRKGNQYLVYSGPSVRLSLQSEPQKVGVFVDYEEGLVSFYDVDAATLMYSCRGCIFTEKLYPFFSPCFHEDGKNTAPLTICPVNSTA
ncbi:hypothetical protein PAMA_016851 [Pampus argenteus]